MSFHTDTIRPRISHPDYLPGEPGPPLLLTGPSGSSSGSVGGRINQLLRQYQREGVLFLWDRVARGEGGILCDDMGLGKTVQVIAFLWAIFNKQGDREDIERLREVISGSRKVNPVLVICPASVLYNWEEELNTWGHFSVFKFHKQEKETTLRTASAGQCEIVLTTFDSARIYLGDLNSIPWSVVVVDECHKIKEASSGITIAMKNLICKKRIGLTGTALQNKYEELWCLLDWANPGCLGSRLHFQSEFSTTMTRGFRVDATKGELAIAREKQAKLNKVKKAWMIRRTKDKVISSQLPTKTDQVVFCGLSEFQRSIFSALTSHPDTLLVLRAWERCPCGKKSVRSKCCFSQEVGTGGKGAQSLLLQIMHIFLKAANHAALLLPKCTTSTIQSSLGNDICTQAFKDHPHMLTGNFRNRFLELSDPRFSGKMQVLTGLLETLEKEGAKVLLFSHSTTLLNILQSFITSRGFSYSRLDGTTRPEIRQQLVKEFNSDQELFIFLISTKAGGLGLNITGANTVIIFDPNWNPSHDLQAQDRAYRIGQTRDVKVFRLVSAGCIEEIIYLRQVYKQQLAAASVDGCSARRYFQGVQGDKRRKGELFGMRNLLKVNVGGDNSSSCLTAEIESRNREMEKKVRNRSKVSLEIRENLLEDKYVNDPDKHDVKDPYNIGLDMDLGNESGVVYTHINQSLVGASREEEHISLCAQKEAQEPGCAWQPAEEVNDLLGYTQAVVDQETDRYDPNTAGNRVREVKVNNTNLVYGNTPTKVRMKIMKDMAKCHGLDIKQLANKIIRSNFEENIKLLQEYYRPAEHSRSVGKLLEEVLNVHHNEDKEAILRRISYCNGSSIKRKMRSHKFKEKLPMKSEGKFIFASDDDELFNAINKNKSPDCLTESTYYKKKPTGFHSRNEVHLTNIVGIRGEINCQKKSEGFSDDDEQLLGIVEEDRNSDKKQSTVKTSNEYNTFLKTKPAPPGLTYSKHVSSNEYNTFLKTKPAPPGITYSRHVSSNEYNTFLETKPAPPAPGITYCKRKHVEQISNSNVKQLKILKDNYISSPAFQSSSQSAFDTLDSMFCDDASTTIKDRFKTNGSEDDGKCSTKNKRTQYSTQCSSHMNDTLDNLFCDDSSDIISTPKYKHRKIDSNKRDDQEESKHTETLDLTQYDKKPTKNLWHMNDDTIDYQKNYWHVNDDDIISKKSIGDMNDDTIDSLFCDKEISVSTTRSQASSLKFKTARKENESKHETLDDLFI